VNQQAVVERRRTLKLNLVEFLGGSCKRCGWGEHPAGLVAHHVNPSKKAFTIGGTSFSWEKIKEEAKKCVLLCSNCHLIVHATNDPYWLSESCLPSYEDMPDNRSKKRKANPALVVCRCGKAKHRNSKLCFACSFKQREKVDWPCVPELKAMVERSSFLAVGRALGVSDNAVRKRIRNHSGQLP
jgi:hypothetical protein